MTNMQNVQSDIMTFRGSHYDLGVETAKWLQRTPLLKNREKNGKKEIQDLMSMSEKHIIFFKFMLLKFGTS